MILNSMLFGFWENNIAFKIIIKTVVKNKDLFIWNNFKFKKELVIKFYLSPRALT
ncbi:MAG: hypothetical protein AMXMBFR50_06510 [Ignavibacterium album]